MTDLSRVVLIAPHRTLEMALPATVPLADIMPVLVQRATMSGLPDQNARGRGRGLTGEGDWVLQRLGSGPLDEDLTPAALQIRDGETLYLRPRDTQLPPVHFDDLIDGLATGVRNRPDRWRDGMTRALFLVLGGTALGVMFAVLLDSTFPNRGAVAGAVAVLLVFSAMMCSRALADAWAAFTFGVAALPFAALAGYTAVDAPFGVSGVGPNVLCAAAAASVTALLVTFSMTELRAVFIAFWLTGLAAVVSAMLMALGLSTPQAASSVATIALVVSAFAPSVAFRLALLRLPQLPTSSADLGEDIDPYPGPGLMSGAVVADIYLTWMLIAVGVICTAALIVLSRTGGWQVSWFIFSVSLVLAIRARGLTSGWQRASAVLPALVGWCLLIVNRAAHLEPKTRVVVVAGLLSIAVVMVAFSRSLPGRRLLPHWGRIADIFEYIVALAMVLLLLAIFDAYQWARALAG